MENLGIGLELLVVGMISVFIILYLVILLGKGLIVLANKFPEAKVVPVNRSESAAPVLQVNDKTKNLIEATVSQLTGGKGHVSKITKL